MTQTQKEKRQQAAKARQAAAKASTKANAEILALHEKLAGKLRKRAQAALERSQEAEGLKRRAARQRRFEIYDEAATQAEQRVAELQARVMPAPDAPTDERATAH